MQPQEIEVWYVIPAVRKEICREMLERGIRKTEIAKKLGLTKSAVTQYCSSKRGGKIKLSEEIRKEISNEVSEILDGGCPTYSIQKILNLARKKDFLCKFHRKLDKMPMKCRKCEKWKSM